METTSLDQQKDEVTQRHVAHDVIEITEAMSGHEAPRFPGDVAGGDQRAEDSLQLPTADLEMRATCSSRTSHLCGRDSR